MKLFTAITLFALVAPVLALAAEVPETNHGTNPAAQPGRPIPALAHAPIENAPKPDLLPILVINPKDAADLLTLLQRVELKGAEAGRMVELENKLYVIAKPFLDEQAQKK